MSVEHPTARQLLKLAELHRGHVGKRFMHGKVDPGFEFVIFCQECKREWPCRTMRALGAKPSTSAASVVGNQTKEN